MCPPLPPTPTLLCAQADPEGKDKVSQRMITISSNGEALVFLADTESDANGWLAALNDARGNMPAADGWCS